ncbi:hypothetical protein GCM10010387_63280 [Streptomyces inusitatus]|uniref:Uncharacterized protein n=1 Tax=Streptomyces inusitatus TaxID=68221 RepID=A0A918QPJ8_9ACTN|nr:hypothetical protein GCM10010387_63280 [Streptomyces inusitatus]
MITLAERDGLRADVMVAHITCRRAANPPSSPCPDPARPLPLPLPLPLPRRADAAPGPPDPRTPGPPDPRTPGTPDPWTPGTPSAEDSAHLERDRDRAHTP